MKNVKVKAIYRSYKTFAAYHDKSNEIKGENK